MHGGVYAINSTETLVGDVKTFEGTGTIACPVQHEDGTVTPETKINLKPDRELVVSYRLVPLNTHDLNVVREMVEETLHLGVGGRLNPSCWIGNSLMRDLSLSSWVSSQEERTGRPKDD